MASIELVDASVEIPIFNSRGRSLKTTLIRRVGGQVEANDRDVVTVKALRRISLSLKPGDRLGLVGHNGAGKSTLLRVFAGSYEPSAGRADIAGTVSSLIDMEMGMDAELTGADNIIQRGVFLGMSLKEARRAIPKIADFSELGPYLHLPMRTYSSGMRMRLAFATSTTRHPDILLFDEMISFGDAGFATRAKARLDAMMDNAKILVLASHDVGSLRSYCNRAVLLEAGTIVAEGSVDDVWDRYIRGVDETATPVVDTPEDEEVDEGDKPEFAAQDIASADVRA
ncbi:ABC transporter ATP-binding protein [Lichenibacterium ramalinae]|uniref:ABC transporter ATP-binding protein n=1 Tax=Lichenibacterium ramalinae TaxID=2316527 RepID=A0A4V1RJ42_9HYPH|nr:ABC transporter ATP-binding protein [Lichenibacterium ramalinae]RYB07008.1 ABC transporter ATP-binding protein [Lichenibacterium ramalinae]